MSDDLIGQVLSGCEIQALHGTGGMAQVYRATRLRDGAQVVVKFLRPEETGNAAWRARFLREAEILTRLSHPNIVRVERFEQEGAQPHLILELIEGQSLQEHLEAGRRFDPKEALGITLQVARGLASAHEHGVIHRDIKPANILLSKDGVAKVLDFGLAKDMLVNDGLSMPGQILGTPPYMAPEQWGNHKVDARCDIFSLGATLYHLVTGALPFPGTEQWDIAVKINEGRYVRPRELNPAIGPELELVIARMLEGDRHYRYSKMRACVQDLERVERGERVKVPCLVAASGEREGTRFPLIGRATFKLGRDEGCDIVLADSSASREHALLERGVKGFSLKDLESRFGTYVSGMRVQTASLKDGEELKFGQLRFVFHDGGLRQEASTRRFESSPEQFRVAPLPAMAVAALTRLHDRRVIVALLRRLAPDDAERRVAEAEALLASLRVPAELQAEVSKRLRARIRRAAMDLAGELFEVTHENLGEDVAAWLVWWDHSRRLYPAQVAPAVRMPAYSLNVRGGEDEGAGEREIALPDEMVLGVGRDPGCDIALRSQSVSRLHATLLRLHDRLALRDEGSRFGSLLNGERVELSLLSGGDVLKFGKVELELREARKPATYEGEAWTWLVDEDLYFVLEELAWPGVARAALASLDVGAVAPWTQQLAQRLFPGSSEGPQFRDAMLRLARQRAERAEQVLRAIAGLRPEEPMEDWSAFVEARLDQWPTQVAPWGWIADAH